MPELEITSPGRSISQVLVWTALPQGRVSGSGTKLRLTAFLTPQLGFLEVDGLRQSTTTNLSSFADWIDWPQTVASATFKVMVNNTEISATIVGSELRSDYWTAMFPPSTTRVDSYAADDFSKQTVKTFQAAPIHEYLTNLYGGFNEGSIEITSAGKVVDPTAGPTKSFTSLVAGKTTVASALDFRALATKVQENPPSEPAAPIFDFHEAIASLGAYPELLRYFGLAIPLEITLPASLASSTSFTIELVPKLTSAIADTVNVTLKTQCTLDSSSFLPTAHGSDYVQGCLDLSNAQFNILDVDIDGAALSISAYNQSLETLIEDFTGTDNFSLSIALPSLRSAGLSLYWSDWGGKATSGSAGSTLNLNTLASRQSTIISAVDAYVTAKRADKTVPALPTVYAEDLTRGWRFDVNDQTTETTTNRGFQSLHWRRGSFSFGAGGTLTIDGSSAAPVEGFVSPGASQPPITSTETGTDNTSAPVFVHESIIRWDGWSLAAPKPTNQINDDGTVSAAAGNPMPNPSNTDEFGNHNPQLSAEFQIPPAGIPVSDPVTGEAVGTTGLPVLRFGHTYTFRARAVDLAGWSVPQNTPIPNSGDPLQGLVPIEHLRWEPVRPPIVLPTAELQPGETNLTLVLTENDDHFATTTSRWLFPPKLHELAAEETGVLDGENGLPQASLYQTLVAHNDGSPNTLPGILTQTTPAGASYLILPVTSGAPPTSTWLPDPYSGGISLDEVFTQNGPNDPSGPYLLNGMTDPWIPAGGAVTWPALPGKLIELVAYTGTPGAPAGEPPYYGISTLNNVILPSLEITPATATSPEKLTIAIARGEVWQIPLQSAIGQTEGLPDPALGVLSWVNIVKPPIPVPTKNARDAGTDSSADGTSLSIQSSTVAPVAMLNLVYAVRAPLATPSFGDPQFARGLTDTAVNIHDEKFTTDGPTTEKVTFTATWTDPVDNPADPSNNPATDTATIRQTGLIAIVENVFTDPVLQDPSVPTVATTQTPFGAIAELDITVTNPGTSMTLDADHRIGDTKHHHVTYDAVGTSRFGQFYAQTVSKTLSISSPTTLDSNGIDASLVTVVLPANGDAPAVTVPQTLYTVDAAAGTIQLIAAGSTSAPRSPSVQPGGQGKPTVALNSTPLDITFVTGNSLSSAPASYHVPNSAPVPGLKINKVVPVWSTTQTEQDATTTVTRVGNMLRVYLERPWYVTGDNEYLGVITAPGDSPGIPANVDASQVSLMGFDPISAAAINTKASYTQTGLSFVTNTTLEGFGQPLYGPAYSTESLIWFYQPTFDPVTNMWFVDVELDVSKFPTPPPPGYFLRLALTRVQPFNIGVTPPEEIEPIYPQTYTSPITLVTFMQPVVDRSVGVIRDGSNATVTVTGPAYVGWRPATAPTNNDPVQDRSNDFAEHPHSSKTGAQHTSTLIVEVQGTNNDRFFTGDFGWTTIGDSVHKLTPTFNSGGTGIVEWSSGLNGIPLPSGYAQLRLRVSELDYYTGSGIPPTVDTTQRRPFVALIEL